jgi:hypothetical protein
MSEVQEGMNVPAPQAGEYQSLQDVTVPATDSTEQKSVAPLGHAPTLLPLRSTQRTRDTLCSEARAQAASPTHSTVVKKLNAAADAADAAPASVAWLDSTEPYTTTPSHAPSGVAREIPSTSCAAVFS